MKMTKARKAWARTTSECCVAGGACLAASLWAAAACAAPQSIELPGKTVFPESVTSTADGTLYSGSLADGGVMKTKPGAARAEPFIKPGAFDSRSILGVFADEKSDTLWACSNDMTALGVPGPSQAKGSALKGFDLKTGEGKVSVPLEGDKTLCNDIAVGGDGVVYVTNSLQPQVLRLKPGAKKFDVFVESPLFNPPAKGAGLDGLAFGADGNLYVNKFTEAALFRVEIKDGKAARVVPLATSQPLVLADAMRPTDGGKSFLMIEGRGQLDRVTPAGDKAKIETLKDGLNGPTGVAQTGDTAWVAEGQLPHLFDKSTGAPQLPFDLKAVKLPAP